jgi:starch synthase
VGSLSEPLYSSADLFLMPSSFEPCGISQMLSMRAGQPCVAHAVGGLKDTITDDVTGFVFEGSTVAEQAEDFVSTVKRAISVKTINHKHWMEICAAAGRQRFSWKIAAETYRDELYQHD